MKHNSLWIIGLLLAPASFAQSPQTRPALPDGGVRERLVSIFIPNIANAAFSATVNTEWVRVLPDNTRITLVNHRLIARDAAGRVFQERRLLVPQQGHQESFVTQTEIKDPVLKLQYICIPSEKTCQVEIREPMLTAVQPPTGTRPPHGSTSTEPQVEALGTRTIGGVETIGTRETVVIPAGEIGNDSTINTSREFWFSPRLGLNLISVRDDPRFGTQRFEVSDIVLGEPDAALFAPPEGSRIIDLRNPPESKAPQPQN